MKKIINILCMLFMLCSLIPSSFLHVEASYYQTYLNYVGDIKDKDDSYVIIDQDYTKIYNKNSVVSIDFLLETAHGLNDTEYYFTIYKDDEIVYHITEKEIQQRRLYQAGNISYQNSIPYTFEWNTNGFESGIYTLKVTSVYYPWVEWYE